MKKYIASALLLLAFIGAALAAVTVNPPPTVVYSATLTAAQVSAFTSQVGAAPAGRVVASMTVRVNPDGSGYLSVTYK